MKCPFELPAEKYEPMTILRDAKMNYICDYGDDENVADYIVQVINSHEKFKTALETILTMKPQLQAACLPSIIRTSEQALKETE